MSDYQETVYEQYRRLKRENDQMRKEAVRAQRRLWVLKHVPHAFRHTFLRWQFWAGMTLGFPLEHFLWEKIWPFEVITRWLGL